MPFDLIIAPLLKKQGWKVKIFDNESLRDPPHVSIIWKGNIWRWSLRERRILDKQPPADAIPAKLLHEIERNHAKLVREWDKKFPKNKVKHETTR